MIKRSMGEKLYDGLSTVLLVVLVFVSAYPLYHVLMASLSDSNRLLSHSGLLLLPDGFSLDAYLKVINNPNILSGYRNTLIIVVFGTALNLVMTTLGAYGLSRRNLYFGNAIMMMIVFTMFFSGGLIPEFMLVSNTLHLRGSLLAILIPSAISTYNLIVMRSSMQALPESLIESAKIDGAGDFKILWRIVIPLSLPIISVMVLFYAVGHWNAWFQAAIYLRDRSLYPLQLILREILILNNTDAGDSGDMEAIGESIKYATIIVATAPILFVYPFLQKFFEKGVMIGAIKE